MNTYDLSILIPSRNEMFLTKTIEDILENIEGNTEVIAVLDGAWADPPINDDPRVTIIHHSESVGQRAATNDAAKLSNAKYVMKCDAHCSFDRGFDVKMMEQMHEDWTMVPLMKNLHAFDWVCEDGHRRYQGPSGPCLECGKETKRDILWKAKDRPNSVSYCFDSTPHFQYFNEFTKRPEGQGDITESMSIQGSCFVMTRNKYWELNICDENFGSWGSQGIEVAVKTWLSGGKVMVNKKTWYAHMFRTQGGDFSFPYPISGKDQEKAKTFARELFFNNNWDKQIYPLSWLVEKFWPVKGWTEEDLAKLKANTFKFRDSGADAKPAESEPIEDNLTDVDAKTEPLALDFGSTDEEIKDPPVLSVIIPSRNEEFLSKTVDDIFKKAKGKIEVIVILDEKDQKLTPRPNLFVHKKVGKPGMKSAINQGIDIARGKYIMKTDAHCMFGEGFDIILADNCKDNWIVIPRRYSLQAEDWTIKQDRPIVDYEYFVFPFTKVTSVRAGGKWYQRAEDRRELLIDETMVFQGSCWFTTKEHYNRIGKLEINDRTKDEFVLEPEELAFKTWLSGGKVMVNKKTWYAHYHKGNGNRGYFIDKKTMKKQRVFHINYWMHDKWPKAIHKMEWFIERFWPIPGWPEDWKDPKYETAYIKSLAQDNDSDK